MKSLIWVLTIANCLFLGALAHADETETPDAIAEEAKLMVEDSYEAPIGRLFNEAAYLRGELPINQFTNVIVINKAASGPTAQTARFYINRHLIFTAPVSTGRENVEIVDTFDTIVRSVFGSKGATQSHWRHTVRGYYPITRVKEATYASAESGYHMPYAMFFNDAHGLALHQVPPDLSGGEQAGIDALGSRASSGCVRFYKDQIELIHNAVYAANQGQIPVINSKTGTQVYDRYGMPKYQMGWKSIVIIEEY